jgi:hypothetical protein
MGFLSFLLLAGATYLIWRITDQPPDLIFRKVNSTRRRGTRRAIDDCRNA